MFTGIIRFIGTITAVDAQSDGTFVTIETPLSRDLTEGDSVAVNGVCLTVLDHTDTSWRLRLMQETLDKTTLQYLAVDDIVNLERPLAVGDRLDGHFVQGHVDGVATVSEIISRGDDRVYTITPPASLLPYFIPKGSVAIDGVSLTVVDVTEQSFTVSVMPYTQEVTTFGKLTLGDHVNIEADMIGKYIRSFVK